MQTIFPRMVNYADKSLCLPRMNFIIQLSSFSIPHSLVVKEDCLSTKPKKKKINLDQLLIHTRNNVCYELKIAKKFSRNSVMYTPYLYLCFLRFNTKR